MTEVGRAAASGNQTRIGGGDAPGRCAQVTRPIKTLLLLGASGDLSGRLLLPALGQLLDAEEERRGLVLVGAGAEDWVNATWK
jgi:hypothetical protein